MAESKEAWVTDMMQSIESNYPAIKSIVWFNTNKELSWGLNLDGNTGLSAYNNAVSGNYFGGPLAIKSAAPEAPVVVEDTSKGRKNKGKPTAKTSLDIKLTGIENALSRVPAVVGQKLLAREAEGIRQMSKENLQSWRLNRLLDQ
jgi:hypothetical protein